MMDRDMWDGVPKPVREVLLRAALLGARVVRFCSVRDYEAPARQRDIASGLSGDTARVRRIWQRELEHRTAAKPSSVRAFGTVKR